MDKLKMQTNNIAEENFKKLSEMFPNAVTETIDENGKVVRAIDKDVLLQEISCEVVEGRDERYQFTWPDKKKAILLANSPINSALRPCREESVDFDNTQNLYIEGDNLDVLKLLRETYLGKIKMIYIDPPYNTGNDFVYNDDFAENTEEYLAHSGQYDEDGNRLQPNTESNGRFHTDWLNMIYPRLKVAKDLLSDDGVVFISIDDNEIENLQKICNEIFGENSVEIYVWALNDMSESTFTKTASNTVRKIHEYIVACYKNCNNKKLGRYLEYRYKDKLGFSNPDKDPRGNWMSANISRNGIKTTTGSKYYKITTPTGMEYTRNWTLSKEEYIEKVKDNRIYFSDNGNGVPRLKLFQNEPILSIQNSIFDDVKTSISGKKVIMELFNAIVFPFTKPIQLLIRLLQIASGKNDIILDFFSGSATTAHAVMQLNAEDGGNRKFIMVQLPEKCDEKSEAYKAGYYNICEIGKERIRRAGSKIIAKMLSDNEPEDKINAMDTGFRVLKLDSSNMKDVYYTPDEYSKTLFDDLEDNIKEDRTAEDLLFQVMLELGIPLSSKIDEQIIDGKKVFNVADNHMLACFDTGLTDDVITTIAKQKPLYFVMRDSSADSDSVAINFDQIFETYSKDTIRRVL